ATEAPVHVLHAAVLAATTTAAAEAAVAGLEDLLHLRREAAVETTELPLHAAQHRAARVARLLLPGTLHPLLESAGIGVDGVLIEATAVHAAELALHAAKHPAAAVRATRPEAGAHCPATDAELLPGLARESGLHARVVAAPPAAERAAGNLRGGAGRDGLVPRLRAGGGLRREGTRRLIRWRADGTLVLPRREEILDPGCLRRGRAQLVHPSLQPRTPGGKLLALAPPCPLLERAPPA